MRVFLPLTVSLISAILRLIEFSSETLIDGGANLDLRNRWERNSRSFGYGTRAVLNDMNESGSGLED
jgi:hypothetical protein